MDAAEPAAHVGGRVNDIERARAGLDAFARRAPSPFVQRLAQERTRRMHAVWRSPADGETLLDVSKLLVRRVLQQPIPLQLAAAESVDAVPAELTRVAADDGLGADEPLSGGVLTVVRLEAMLAMPYKSLQVVYSTATGMSDAARLDALMDLLSAASGRQCLRWDYYLQTQQLLGQEGR